MTEVLFYSILAGAMIPLSGWLASKEHIRRDWLRSEFRHGVIAFGGGALLSAVALVLIPEGSERLPAAATLLTVGLGAVLMTGLDMILARRGSPARKWRRCCPTSFPRPSPLARCWWPIRPPRRFWRC